MRRVLLQSMPWHSALLLIALSALAGAQAWAREEGEKEEGEKVGAVPPPVLATRIVSLDYCADQYVLQFADRQHILALSPDSTKSFSYLRHQARGLPQIRPLAEDVLIAQPDLVVRSYGGGPNALGFFAASGVAVLQVGYANDLNGIKQVATDMAAGLGVPARGAALVAEMDRRLQAIEVQRSRQRADTTQNVLYMTSGGATSGPGTLIHEMFLAAGLRNFQEQPGWRSLPLERLAYERPDAVALARFNTGKASGEDSTDIPAPNPWSVLRHPIAQHQLNSKPATFINGAWTSCGAWFLLDAIEALAP